MAPSLAEQGSRFEKRVAELFRMLGFSVEHDVLVSGRQADMRLIAQRGPLAVRYLVECKDHAAPVKVAHLDAFLGRLRSAQSNGDPTLRGILVARTGFVKEVREQASSLGVDLIVAAELERSLVDLPGIVQAQLHELREDRGVREFVEPSLRLDGRTDSEPALNALREWLNNSGQNHLTLLADFGVGKTTLLRSLAVRLADEFLGSQDSIPTYAPIYVDLREYSHISLRQIVLDLFDRYRVDLASTEAFWEVLQNGQIVLLLDGFDELASKSSSLLTLQHFQEINRSALGRAKLILSCRTHYFVDDAQVQESHGVRESLAGRAYSDLYREIAGRPNFEIRHLEDFDQAQISSLIRARGQAGEEEVWSVLESRYNLADLARRPVLLDMILTSFEQIRKESGEVTSAVLYQVYTDIWLERNDWNTVLTPDARASLIETFAARVSHDPRAELNYTEIPALVHRVHPELDRVATEQCDQELRRAGFLVRDSAGNYRFAHKSFREFFHAKRIVRVIREWDPRQIQVFAGVRSGLTSEVYRFVCDLVRHDDLAVERAVEMLEASSLSDADRGLAIKFVSRTPTPMVIGALERFVEQAREHDKSVPSGNGWRWDSWALPYAVTALGWLDRDADLGRFEAILLDEHAGYVTRHNALIALCRSNDPAAGRIVARFVASCAPADAVALLASRIVATVLDDDEQVTVGDAIVTRWYRDAQFRDAFDRARQNLEWLCTLCARSSLPEAPAILRHVATTAQSARAVAAATCGLKGPDLSAVEAAVIASAREDQQGAWLALVDALEHLGTERAGVALAGMVNGPEPVMVRALTVLSQKWPELARATVYEGAQLWRGRHWSDRLRLTAAALLHDRYRADTVWDIEDLIRTRSLTPSEARDALAFLADHAPSRTEPAVRAIFSRAAPVEVLVYAAECLYRTAPDAGRAFLLEHALVSPLRDRRLTAAIVLLADTDEAVTEALVTQLADEHDLETRTQIARALIAPGRTVTRAGIEELAEVEPEPAVRAVLQLAIGERHEDSAR